MLVTNVTPQKRDPAKYNIYIDGVYFFALLPQDMEYFGIKEGKEVAEKTVTFIQNSLIYEQAQNVALRFIGYKMRTEKEVLQKLQESEFSETVVEEVLVFLSKYNYTDDREYARRYIKERLRLNPKSAYALQMELSQRGISKEICEEILDETEFSEMDDVLMWIEKKTKGDWPPDEKKKKQLYGFLQRKGYAYGVIKDAFLEMDEKEEM